MKHLTIVLLTVALMVHALGQDDSGIRLRPMAFAYFENVDELTLREGKKELGRVTLPTRHLTSETRVNVREFSIGVGQDDAFRPLGKVVLPERGRDFLLVLVPVKSGYHVFPVRADDPAFKGNDVCFFNFTPHRILVALGKTRAEIDSANSLIVTPYPKAEATIYKALFAYVNEGKVIPFNNSRWPVNTRTKSMVFVYWDEENERLTYRSVSLLAND